MKKKVWLWFTLMEMLIVIVIIGILAAAILPKITGHLARTRDLQRHMDLNALSTAIIQYKSDKWTLPNRGTFNTYTNYRGSINLAKNIMNHGSCGRPTEESLSFSTLLKPYLMDIPKDPNRKQQIKIHRQPTHKMRSYEGIRWDDRKGGCNHQPGQYLYQAMRKWTERQGESAVLVAKVETPDATNYVLYDKSNRRNYVGGLRNISVYRTDKNTWAFIQTYWPEISEIKLCSSVKKGENADWTLQSNWEYHCTYTDEEQLYYILKIED